jgi:hypothetical protein
MSRMGFETTIPVSEELKTFHDKEILIDRKYILLD